MRRRWSHRNSAESFGLPSVTAASSFLLVPSPMSRPSQAEARAAAMRATTRGNMMTAGVLLSFVGGVFFYCTRAVAQDEITQDELERFRQARARERQSRGE